MVRQYNHRDVITEAIQYNGNRNKLNVENFLGVELKSILESETAYVAGAGPPIFSLLVSTINGDVQAFRGDYIVKETYLDYDIIIITVYKSSVFQKIYQELI